MLSCVWDGPNTGLEEEKNDRLFDHEQQIKRELKRSHVSGCRCNERLKAKTDGSKRLAYTGFIFQFITTDKAKASRGGGKVSVL